LSSDTSDARNGHATARLEASGSPRESAKLMRIDRSPDDLRGKRIRIRAMIRSEQATTGAGLFATAGSFDASRRFTNVSTKPDLPVRGTTGWLQFATTLAVPAEADVLEYGVRLEGTGTVWVDDVAVEVIPEVTKRNGR
jgi:hypothetical protein